MDPVTIGAIVAGGTSLVNLLSSMWGMNKEEQQANEYNHLMGEQYEQERSDSRFMFDTNMQHSKDQFRYAQKQDKQNRAERKKSFNRDTALAFADRFNSLRPTQQVRLIQAWGRG